MACSPLLCNFEPGSPKPAIPPTRSILTIPMTPCPRPVSTCTWSLQSHLFPAGVDCPSNSSIARVELSRDGPSAIGKGLHLHRRPWAEAGHGFVPDLADLVPAVPTDRLGDRA